MLNIRGISANFNSGSISKHLSIIKSEYQKACTDQVDILVTPEGALGGYPTGDIIFTQQFKDNLNNAINELLTLSIDKETAILVGCPIFNPENNLPYNGALLISNGKIIQEFHKYQLPSYGVFFDKRHYQSSDLHNLQPLIYKGHTLAVLICEDNWFEKPLDIILKTLTQKMDLVIVINVSPYSMDKLNSRLEVCFANSNLASCPLFYINRVGAQDGLVFDGRNMLVHNNQIIGMQKPWLETHSDIRLDDNGAVTWLEHNNSVDLNADIDTFAEVYQAMILGLRTYYNNNPFFKGILIGLSGGVDSTLTAMVAADALGADKVHTIMMPSVVTSDESFNDAQTFAKNIDMAYQEISIAPMVDTLTNSITPAMDQNNLGLAFENMQARIRGDIIMSVSNSHNYLVLTTGNKSEIAVGYCTMYGDMCGGYSVIGDLYKTMVFDICRWRNANVPEGALVNKLDIIPTNIITKEPTAELRENQKDSDSLPQYEILDQILYELLENQGSIKSCLKLNLPQDEVLKAFKLLQINEYKRYQSTPTVRVSSYAFRQDRHVYVDTKMDV